MGQLRSICGGPDDTRGRVRADAGLPEKDIIQVRWMGCAHESKLFWQLGDVETYLLPDSLTARMGGIQIVKLIHEDGSDALTQSAVGHQSVRGGEEKVVGQTEAMPTETNLQGEEPTF
jgi:hypothetical protein